MNGKRYQLPITHYQLPVTNYESPIPNNGLLTGCLLATMHRMYQQNIIVRTKLVPPRPPRQTLPRPRITQRLLDARDALGCLLHFAREHHDAAAARALTTRTPPITFRPYTRKMLRL